MIAVGDPEVVVGWRLIRFFGPWSARASSLFDRYIEKFFMLIARCAKKFLYGKIPIKIKIFLWKLARGHLPAGDQFVLHHGPYDGFCVFCGSV